MMTEVAAGKQERQQARAPRKLSEDGLVYVDETSDIGIADQEPAALVNGYALPSLSRSRIDLVVGGAGFKTAAKWMSCRQATGDAHYVVGNADEGEPGTFKDRVLLQSCPDLVLEGMTVCARVIGAHQGRRRHDFPR